MKRLLVLFLLAMFWACPCLALTDVPLSPQEKKNLDTFFSNFAEVNMRNFSGDTLTDEDLLYFATWHCIINDDGKFKKTKDGDSIVIPAEAIDKVTQRYLGRTIKKHTQKEYVESSASGDAYVFAQVDSLQKRDDGTYLARGTVYATGSGAVIDPHGTEADWEKAGETVNPQASFTGIVRKADGEADRYVLLEYAMQERP